MTRFIPGRRFFFTAYALLAVVFLTVHFTRVDSFSAAVGEMTVKGYSSIGTSLASAQIRRLKISFNGLEFLFRRGNEAVITTEDGIRHPVSITGWDYTKDSINVSLEHDAGFSLSLDSHGTGITLTPIIPSTVPPVAFMELPLRPEGSTVLTVVDSRPVKLEITHKDRDYIASLPSESSWSPENHILKLVVLNKAEPVVLFAEDEKGGGIQAAEWFRQQTPASESMYSKVLEDWLYKSREGWKFRRNSRSGLWEDEEGTVRWDNSLAAAFLADAVSRNQLTQVFQNVLSSAENAPREINWLPSPYLGNIVNQTQGLLREQSNTAKQLISAIDKGEAAPESPAALDALLNSGYRDQAQKLLQMVREGIDEGISNAEVVNRISLLQEAENLSLDSSGDPALREKLFDDYLLPRVFWVQDGLWLVEDDGSINLALSVNAGLLLREEARRNNSAFYQAAGRQLVLSALGTADDKGMIPRNLFFEGNGEVLSKGKIPPEDIMAGVAELPAFPRMIPLAKELGTGAWALTAAERFTVRSTPRETSITLDFPSGGTHHLAVHGIKPFIRFNMQGIDWNSDPNFQRYYAGWKYDENTQTLYVKILHRADTEVIRLYYYEGGSAGP